MSRSSSRRRQIGARIRDGMVHAVLGAGKISALVAIATATFPASGFAHPSDRNERDLPNRPSPPRRPPLDLATPYSVDVWKAEDGLPQNSVQAITSRRGTATCGWAPRRGSSRFDGVRSHRLHNGNTEGLGSSYIRALCSRTMRASSGSGTDGGGLSFPPSRTGPSRPSRPPTSCHTTIVSAIAEDHEGDLWIGT
jgi:hypothetical protein